MRIVSRFGGVVVLGAVVLFAAHGGSAEAGGMCRSTAITTASGVAVEVRNNCFEPTVIEVRAGESVTWTNGDGARHTVTGVNQTWGSGEEFGRDEQVSFRFDEPGIYAYTCLLHPLMIGAVSVTDDEPRVPVSDLVTAGSGVTTDDPTVTAVDDGDRGPLVLAVGGGVVLGLAVGLVSSAGWRHWRVRRT